jgi:hypothetical protein
MAAMNSRRRTASDDTAPVVASALRKVIVDCSFG